MQTRDFNIGLDRKVTLPVVTMTNGITINFYDPYDMANAKAVVPCLLERFRKLREAGFETIATPATKPIPIGWFLAYELGFDFVVIKKELKPYHIDTLSFNCRSITSDRTNRLFVTEQDAQRIRGKRVILFDDVISTGATYVGCRDFIKGTLQAKDFKAFFVFREGEGFPLDPWIDYLGTLPI